MSKIDELFIDIEKERTKEELKEYIEFTYSKIRDDEELIKMLQLKKGRFKELREELIPLCNYSYSIYARKNSKYRIVIGNQKYDAIELYNDKEYRIEFTEFHNGSELYHLMKSMHSNNGVGFIGGRDYTESKQEFLKGFEENVRKKVNNTYEEMRIIFLIPNEAYGWVLPEVDEKDFFSELVDIIKQFDFGSNEVYIMKPSSDLIDETGSVMSFVK
jgi:hypothetical protein